MDLDAAYERLKLPRNITVSLNGSAKMEMALLPAGSYYRGSPEREPPDVRRERGLVPFLSALFFALGLILPVLWEARRKRRRPAFSIDTKCLLACAILVALGSGVSWYMAARSWWAYDATAGEDRLYRVTSERPRKEVLLQDIFYIAKTEVTQECYEAVMGRAPAQRRPGVNLPVTLSWEEAVAFCQRVNESVDFWALGLNPDPSVKIKCWSMSLPTEAQWECACRGFTDTAYWFGDDPAGLEETAWFGQPGDAGPTTVGQRRPNPVGLFDMYGNVAEYVRDLYVLDYYNRPSQEDPLCEGRVWYENLGRGVRGGNWCSPARDCRSAARSGSALPENNGRTGFRPVLVPTLRNPYKWPGNPPQ
jgi:formylglycine-generating enzyme required for sulfatase activity